MRMKSFAQTKTHRVGWIRPTARFPAGQQIAAVGAHCKITYNASSGDTLGHVVASLRKGSEVYVSALHRLGDNRRELAAALDAISKAGGRLYDIEAGAYIDTAALEAVSAALGVMQGEARMPTSELARKRGKKGGRPVRLHMTDAEAKQLWADTEKSAQSKADAIGLSLRACYHRFGKSGRAAGWPAKKPKSEK